MLSHAKTALYLSTLYLIKKTMSMPSMEGEEECYLKNNFLAHEAPLEAHNKQKGSASLFFHRPKFCLGLSQQKGQYTSVQDCSIKSSCSVEMNLFPYLHT